MLSRSNHGEVLLAKTLSSSRLRSYKHIPHHTDFHQASALFGGIHVRALFVNAFIFKYFITTLFSCQYLFFIFVASQLITLDLAAYGLGELVAENYDPRVLIGSCMALDVLLDLTL